MPIARNDGGLNLRNIVAGAVHAVHPDERVTLYRNLGQRNDRGVVTPLWSEGVPLAAQVQSEGDDALYHAGMAGQSGVVRKFYLGAGFCCRDTASDFIFGSGAGPQESSPIAKNLSSLSDGNIPPALTPNELPQGLNRAKHKAEDMLLRADGTWWKITGVLEDFSQSGWACVRAVLQHKAPQGLENGLSEVMV